MIRGICLKLYKVLFKSEAWAWGTQSKEEEKLHK
jgi:hypothetical protein